jgi:hypothetical protein
MESRREVTTAVKPTGIHVDETDQVLNTDHPLFVYVDQGHLEPLPFQLVRRYTSLQILCPKLLSNTVQSHQFPPTVIGKGVDFVLERILLVDGDCHHPSELCLIDIECLNLELSKKRLPFTSIGIVLERLTQITELDLSIDELTQPLGHS